MNSRHTAHIYEPKLKVGTIYSPSFEMYNVNELCAKRKSESAVVVRFQIENGKEYPKKQSPTNLSITSRLCVLMAKTAAPDFNDNI